MIPLTVAVAVVCCVAALFVGLPRALGILVASTLLYPECLRIPMGACQMSAPRLVALCIVLRALCSTQRTLFRWRALDVIVTASWAWTVIANMLAGAESWYVNEAIGRVFDTVIIYFAARLSIAEYADHQSMFLPVALTALAMGVCGAVEAITFWSPYTNLLSYATWSWFDKDAEIRWGMLRAQGSTGHAIYFGLAMTIIAGYLYAIRSYSRPFILWVVAVLAGMIAALSSLSSGPQMALTVLIAVNVFYFFPRLIKPSLVMLAILVVAMECASNRHVWYLVEYINIAGGDSWYRGRLIDVAIQQWQEYWLVGVGTNLPNHWGMLIDGRNHVDIVNQYIIVAISAGFLGVILFVAAQVLAMRDVVVGWRASDVKARRLRFGFAAIMIGISFGMTSVGLYGPPLLFTYMLLGLMLRPLNVYARQRAESRQHSRRSVRARPKRPRRGAPLDAPAVVPVPSLVTSRVPLHN
jgi:hypothetical protein